MHQIWIRVHRAAKAGECGVQGRLKSIYSIYKKMIRKKIPVRQVYDARALRIIVDDEGASRTGDAWAAAYRWAALQLSCADQTMPPSIDLMRKLLFTRHCS